VTASKNVAKISASREVAGWPKNQPLSCVLNRAVFPCLALMFHACLPSSSAAAMYFIRTHALPHAQTHAFALAYAGCGFEGAGKRPAKRPRVKEKNAAAGVECSSGLEQGRRSQGALVRGPRVLGKAARSPKGPQTPRNRPQPSALVGHR
jgi:hypothetical protein